MAEDSLKAYRAKRDFTRTSEPTGGEHRPGEGLRFVVQKHDASRLHFDFRLEYDGVLKSWAVTRGPSLDPAEKRLAVHVEDHPLDYGDFEGTIPAGEYGGGTVMLWDEGTWEPLEDAAEGLAAGKLKFILHGSRLNGAWALVRMHGNRDRRSKADNWLLIKERDGYAVQEKNPLTERALTSIRTGRSMAAIAEDNVTWTRAGRQVVDSGPGRKRAPRTVASRGDPLPPPAFVEPQMATLVDEPPTGPSWVHEIKYDGYRALTSIGGGQVIIRTRKGLDWTERFQGLVPPLADLPCRSALLDGEIAVQDGNGRTDFGLLQDALATGKGRLVYYLFDLLELDGKDLRRLPLTERKAKLAELLADSPPSGQLVYSDHVEGEGEAVFEQARKLGLEGIISKRADAPYRSERGKAWLKIKTGLGQEFIVIGWEPSEVKGKPFGAILTAVREGDKLSYRGKVGSGFSHRDIEQVWPELQKREVSKPPADDIPLAVRRKVHFVKPELLAEIAFRGWSRDGLVRQGSFKGLRFDKPAQDVVDEIPQPAPDGKGDAKAPGERVKTASAGARHTVLTTVHDDRDGDWIEIEGVRLTHPKRVVYPGKKITKKALVDYYLAFDKRILRHIAGRPLSLVRCPRGQGGDCFFHKHAQAGFPDAFRPITIKEKEGSDVYLYIEDRAGLVAAVQMGALELHIWGSHVATLEQPDRLVFDFDPDEEIPFDAVKDAAREMRERLAALKLTSFVMATGGKGLHVVVPLTPRHPWEDVRVFAEALARTMAAETPDRYLAVMSKAKRKGRIFIDYLRNGRGATAIAPFSTRAKPSASLAWPISWAGLARLESAQPVTVDTAAERLKSERSDPWRGYFDVDQVLPLEALRGG